MTINELGQGMDKFPRGTKQRAEDDVGRDAPYTEEPRERLALRKRTPPGFPRAHGRPTRDDIPGVPYSWTRSQDSAAPGAAGAQDSSSPSPLPQVQTTSR